MAQKVAFLSVPIAVSQWKAMYIVPFGWKAGEGVRFKPQQG
jgi:hypothetical protein|eukprot:COSAG06_NODE_21997_length_738_cov_0.762128_1_plen_41_part_00